MNPVEVKQVRRDGLRIWKVRCPECGIWGDVDYEQLDGRVSLDCPNCPYHETHNLSSFVRKGAEGQLK